MKPVTKIALLGTRGIPNNYGGFEQFVQFFAEYLDDQHFEVVVYNPNFHRDKNYHLKNVKIVYKWCPEKLLGSAAHFVFDFLCLKDSLKRKHDIIFEFGYGTVALSYFLLPKVNSKIITNMDGIEWKRSKWNFLIKKFMKWSESVAVEKSDILISDNKGIQDYIKKEYNKDSIMIPYGANVFENPDKKILKNFDLKKREYFLTIARLEPENNIDTILDGFIISGSELLFIVVGNYSNKYGKYLLNKYRKYPKIIFFNGIYNLEVLNNLRYFSKYYFHGHSVGGTNPSLLEAMACSSLIIANGNVFNKNVLGSDGFFFDSKNDISELLNSKELLEKNRDLFVKNNLEKIKTSFSWENINKQYVNIIENISF